MAGNYVLLETIELTQSAASVTFDNIPQSGYTDLRIVTSTRTDLASPQQTIVMRINGLSSGYVDKYLYGGGAAGAGSGAFGATGAFIADTSAANATANTFGSHEIHLFNYLSSNAKSWSVEGVAETNSTTAYMELTAGYNSTTSAISTINFAPTSGNFVSGSSFSLYGIAATGTTPTVAPKATGGNMVSNDGTYWYHTFLTSGTFAVQTPLTCDVLVVGGGGGGCTGISGSSYGGGGAGGTAYEHFGKTVAIGNKVVLVGAGGTGSGTNAVAGTAGNTSSVVLDTTYSATGGNPGRTTGQGGSNALYSGGASDAGGNGGGGAGAGGNGGGANTGGNGTAGSAGSGFSSTILGYTVAGGSTGSANGTVPAAVDGGGRGSTDTPNYAGAAPTKFGGGGASVSTAAYRTGFNGVVVIRYAMV